MIKCIMINLFLVDSTVSSKWQKIESIIEFRCRIYEIIDDYILKLHSFKDAKLAMGHKSIILQRHGVPNHRRLDCYFYGFFRLTAKNLKTQHYLFLLGVIHWWLDRCVTKLSQSVASYRMDYRHLILNVFLPSSLKRLAGLQMHDVMRYYI